MLVDNKPICHYYWDLRDAEVVCKMMNMSALAAIRKSQFGRVNRGEFGMDDVRCEGGEKDVRNCTHDTKIPPRCHGGDAAGVVCDGGNTDYIILIIYYHSLVTNTVD